MRYLLFLLILFFNVEAYDASFFVGSDDNLDTTVYSSTDDSVAYTVALNSSSLSSQSEVFYVPFVVKDANHQVVDINHITISVDNEDLSLTNVSSSGQNVIKAPITFNHVRAFYVSGTAATIPVVMTVSVDETTTHILKFNLFVHGVGYLNVSQNNINWAFSGNWSDCVGTVGVTYRGIISSMKLSITSDNNFNMVSPKNSTKIAYSVSCRNMTGNKTSGYETKINDAETVDLTIQADSANPIYAPVGQYTDTITIALIPDI